MTQLSFTDPRQYAVDYPTTNIIINQALQVASGEIPQLTLENSIRNLLKNNNDALINVALNLSPSNNICQIIWQALNNAININYDTQNTVCLFTIPIVIVAGSKKKDKLPKDVSVDELNSFFKQNDIISSDINWFISGKLIEPQNIAKFKPSQFYYWVRNIPNAKLWLPIELDGSSINVENEGVFLRFLVGVANLTNNEENPMGSVFNQECYHRHSMSLMQFLVEELKTDGVTIFPIPYAPLYLSNCVSIADNYRKEIAISVALSNIIRKIRENSLTPIVQVCKINNGIEIKTITQENSQFTETSIWSLTNYDELDVVIEKIISLLQEMNVEYQIKND